MLGKRAGIYFFVSVLSLLLAVLLAAWGFPKIVQKQIQKSIQLDNSSMMFEKWRKLPMALDFKIYVFNVTNAEGISNGDKPRLQEIGPYVYKEYRERDILEYGDNDTVKYMLRKQLVFDQEASGSLSEDDEVTVIHFPYLGALLTVHDMMPGLIGMINPALEQLFSNVDDAFLRVKVKDLFFDGILLDCSGNHSALGLVCSNIKALTPPTMRPNEDGTGFYFSMFSHLNRTASGPYAMVRGTQDIAELGHIVAYKDMDHVNAWGDQYCGMLNGSDGTIFPPIDQSRVPDKLYTFQPDICRSLSIELVGKDSVNNMSAYYYELTDKAFASKSANPNNKCFCKKNWSANHDGCLLMGVLNLMPCQGAPAIASMPHYYLASEELLEFFEEGIEPDKMKHTSYIYLEPTTGVVLKGVQRLQFNIELRRMKVPQLEKVPTGVFPLLWIEESAELPPEVVDELKQAQSLLKWVEGLRWTILGLAILATIIAGYFFAKAKSISLWPNKNSVSFIRPNGIDISKNY